MLSNTGGQLKEEPVQHMPSPVKGQNRASINTGALTLPHDVGECKVFSTCCRVFIGLNPELDDNLLYWKLDRVGGML